MGNLLAYWAVVEVVGLLAVPLAAVLFRRIPGRGLTLARPLALLVASYPVWLLASLEVAPYARATALCGVALLAALSALIVWRGRRVSMFAWAGSTEEERGNALRLLIAGEALFALAFLAMVLLRAQVPDVWMNDKPMNMAFINAIDRSDYFPPVDPWAAGLDLNYYYFGHYLAAFVIGIAGVEPATGYNLSLALVVAMAASGVFGAAATLHLAARGGAWKRAALAGVVAVVFALLLGNVAGALDYLHDPVRPSAFVFRDAGSVIPFTINDFPFLSFLIANVHAHTIAIPFQLLALMVAIQVGLAGPARGRLVAAAEIAFASLALGSLYAINSWSFPPALAIFVAALAVWAVQQRTRDALVRAALTAVAVAAGSFLVFAPFHLEFEPAVDGVGRVVEQTRTRDFVGDELAIYGLFAWVLGGLMVWRFRELAHGRTRIWVALAAIGVLAVLAPPAPAKLLLVGGVLALALYWAIGARESPAERLFWLLTAAGVVAATIGEFMYVRDFNDGGPFFRLITVFKLGYQAWVLLAIAAAYALLSARGRPAGLYRRVWLLGATVLVVATAGWSVVALAARLGADEAGPTLDGMRWLERQQPGDAAAIDWLRANADGRPVVLEAVGDGGLHTRVATFTGLPTVMGAPGHEKQWNHPAESRPRDAATIYRTMDPAEARRLLARYDVRYVVIGSVERTDHPGPGLGKFDQIGTMVLENAGTRVYRVEPGLASRRSRVAASRPPSARSRRPR